MYVPPYRVSGEDEAESHPVLALLAFRKVLSRNTRHFMIVVMAVMGDAIDSRLGHLLPGTI
jgi:hypothetical protein